MKKSNIIITSLIASITLLITTGMMELRIKGVPHGSVAHKKPVGSKQTSIQAFHFVVVQDCQNVALETSDAFNLEMIDLPDSVMRLSYQVQNDTFYIKGIANPERDYWINIKAPAQQVKGIRASHSQIIVHNFPLDQLTIRADNATISLNAQQPVNALTIEGRNSSKIDFQSTFMIHTLDLNLDHSEMYAFSSLGKLKGSIRNQSRAQLKDVGELTFTKDDTSHLQVWSE